MAPKRNNKRESSAPPAKGAAAAKKSKVAVAAPEPLVEEVVTDPRADKTEIVSRGLDSAMSLPEATRAMLKAILPCSLQVLPAERHVHQESAIELIEKALQEAEHGFVEKVDATENELETAKELKVQRSSEGSEAQADLTKKQQIVEEQVTQTLAAKDELKEAEKSLMEAQNHKKAVEQDFVQLASSKEAFDKALASSKALHEGQAEDSTSIVNFVLPLCEKQGLDESLCKAFPAAASKKKDERGDFDSLVLTEVVKVLEEEVGKMAEKLANQEPTMQDCQDQIQNATETVATAMDKKTAVEEELANARQEEQTAKAAAAAATAATAEAERQIATCSDAVSKAKKGLEEFRCGALAAFHALNGNDEAAKMEEVAENDASASPQAMEEDLKVPQAEEGGSSVIKVPTPCRSVEVEEPAVVPPSES